MGLGFTVGNPSDVFTQRFARKVQSRLRTEFGEAVVLDSPDRSEYFGEAGSSWWAKLQRRAERLLGADRVPHLLSMEAWSGCYLPADTEPTTFAFAGETSTLDVASLPALIAELEAVGAAAGMAMDDASLRGFVARHDDDDHEDDVEAALLLAHLLPAARVAARRRQPL